MRPLHLPHAIHLSSRPIRRMLRGLLVFVAVVMVILALMATALRLALPYLNDYRQNVQTLLTQAWGSPVTFAEINVAFVGYQPQLILKDVHLGQKGPVIAQLGASLSLWRSAMQGRWVAGKIVIEQPQLQFNLQADGQWLLAGAPKSSASADSASWRQWLKRLPDLGDISVQNAQITWSRPANLTLAQPARSLTATLSATARLAAHGWSLSGELTAAEFGAQSVRVRAQGRLGDEPATELYINTRGWRLPAMQQAILAFTTGTLRAELGGCRQPSTGLDCASGLPVFDQGHLTGELWLRFAGSDLSSVHAGFDVTDIHVSRLRQNLLTRGGALSSQSQANPSSTRVNAALKQLNGQLVWQKMAQGWRLDADQVGVVTEDNERLPLQSVHVINQADQTMFATDFADLNQLSVWLATAPLPQTYLALLGQNAVRGQARDVRLEFQGDHLVSGYLELNHFGNVPGARLWPVIGQADHLGGLNLTLYKQPAGWIARINQHNLVLAVPGMFREPMTIDTLKTDLYWHDSEAPLIYSPDITFKNADLSLNGRFRYQAADGAAAQPAQLSVDARFSRIAVARVPAYLPRNLLDNAVLDWLDQSLDSPNQKGQVNQGQFVFNGDPQRFPFVRGGGWFSVVFDFDHLNLPYLAKWPNLMDAKGHIAFVNQQFHTEIDQGTVANVSVAGARVSIFDLDHPELDLALKTQAPLAHMLGFIQQSPLMAQGSLNAIKTTGNAALDLSVKVGLTHGGHALTQGSVQLKDNGFMLDKTPVNLNKINGLITFSDTDFNGTGLVAQFAGAPVTFSVVTAKKADTTVINAQTELDPLFALRTKNSPAFEPFLGRVSGKAMTTVRVNIPHQGNIFNLSAHSDLQGVESLLPEPFAKTPEARWPLTADLRIEAGVLRSVSINTQAGSTAGSGAEGKNSLKSSGGWQVKLGFNPAGDLAQGQVRNDGDAAKGSARAADSLDLSLTTPIFDWDQWQPLLMGAPAPVKGDATPAPFRVRLKADQLRAAGFTFPTTVLDLTYLNNNYTLTAQGAALDGTAHYQDPDKTHPAGLLTLKLNRLFLQSKQESLATTKTDGITNAAAEPTPITSWNLARIPDASIAISDLKHNTHDLGQISFDLARAPSIPSNPAVLRISAIDWQPTASIQISGQAEVAGEGAAQQSSLNLSAKGSAFGTLLKRAIGSSPIDGGTIKTADFSLHWPGAPSAFALARLNGSGQFELTQGQLNDVDPGVGRLAGLLSLGALTRRLRMDFSDVVDQGLQFDSLSAQWQIKHGELSVAPLILKNAALSATAKGATNLRTQSLNYTVHIYADIGMLLPIIGTVAGGPLVGGAVLALQQAFSALNKNPAPTVTYHIGGSIAHPIVKTIDSSAEETKP
ncbi:MAG TPA: DUF3971 domain-containing protein [Halothiobacillus sp.]|nr:DUF3971 domain-containing protein [Halothiobacillus sp.]